MAENLSLSLLRTQIDLARHAFESTLTGVGEEQLHFQPGGTANPISSTYAHTILSEDNTLHVRVKGETPLSAGAWAGRTGLSEPLPNREDPEFQAKKANWFKTVRVDRVQFDAFAKAVHAETDAYLASLSDADLTREVDLGPQGRQTVGYFISRMWVLHMSTHTGEIAVVKGLQGLEGFQY